ncbi:MAG: hypothetical protein ACYC4Q_00800, partial [Victivallaceae bacterium]
GEMPSADDLLQFWDAENAEKLVKTVMQLPFFKISSTEMRNLIAKNEKVGKLISRDVKRYIKDNGLYEGTEK